MLFGINRYAARRVTYVTEEKSQEVVTTNSLVGNKAWSGQDHETRTRLE
jgi:hypothetical protein